MSEQGGSFLVRDYTPPPPEQERSEDRQSGTATKERPTETPPKHLPRWRVLLHNDDVNTVDHVVMTIVMLTELNTTDAIDRTVEAHNTGVSLLLVTHQERAELYVEQFASRSLTVTIEPEED